MGQPGEQLRNVVGMYDNRLADQRTGWVAEERVHVLADAIDAPFVVDGADDFGVTLCRIRDARGGMRLGHEDGGEACRSPVPEHVGPDVGRDRVAVRGARNRRASNPSSFPVASRGRAPVGASAMNSRTLRPTMSPACWPASRRRGG